MQQLMDFFSRSKITGEITVCHIAVYAALLHCWSVAGCNNPVTISRQQIMRLAKIKRTAYHQCMKELHQLGFIEYVPSYHPVLGSLVYLNVL